MKALKLILILSHGQACLKEMENLTPQRIVYDDMTVNDMDALK